MPQPPLVLHSVPYSHPVLAVSTALDHLGLEYELVQIPFGKQAAEVEATYGEGRRTVPGLLVGEEPVHGSVAIFNRLENLVPDSGLYPEPQAAAIREAEAGLAQEIQQSARVLIFGALHFRPDSMGTFAGVPALDPSGVDFAIRSIRGAWKYLGIDAQLLHATAQALPGQLDALDALADEGVVGGDRPTAADFQFGSSLQLLSAIGDVRPLLSGRPSQAVVEAWFEAPAADVPAGALPAGWVPSAVA